MIHRRRPLYSADNEDSRSELRALAIAGEDTVVSICAGGGRALSLLSAEPRRLVALDRRVDQLFQLEIKAAAMDGLDYPSFAGFIGLCEAQGRRDIYSGLRPSLSPSARRYWDGRLSLVEEGVLYCGRQERRMMRFVGWVRSLGALEGFDRFFEATDLEAQLALFDADGGRIFQRERFFRIYFHPVVNFLLNQDPSFLRSTEDSIGRYMHRRFAAYVGSHLLRDSYLLHLALFGRFPPGGPLPPYLSAGEFERAKKCLDRLDLVHASAADFVARSRLRERLKWSLSDVSAWMPERSYQDLLRLVCLHGRPGSRLCARYLAARHSIPADLHPRTQRLDELCDRLDREDASIYYRFDVIEYGD